MPSLGKQIIFDEYSKAIITSNKTTKLSFSLNLHGRYISSFHLHSILLSIFYSNHKWVTYVKRDEKRFISSVMNVKAGFIEPAGVSEDSPER
jgi:hypothetical protein